MQMRKEKFRNRGSGRDSICTDNSADHLCGDAIGSVILMGKSEKDIFGESEKMLVQTAAGF